MKTEIQKEFKKLSKKAIDLENNINDICNNLASGNLEKLYNDLETINCKLQSTRFAGQKNINAVDCEVHLPQFIKGRNIS